MTIDLIKAAGVRALRTFIQTVIPALGAGALTELNYVEAASIAGAAALISFLQGVLAGLPEAVESVAVVYEPTEYLPEGNFVTDSAGTWNADDIGDPTPAGE